MNESMLQFQDLTRQLDVLKNLKIKVENGEKNDISKEELDNQIQKLKKELPSTDSLPEDLEIINFLKTQIEGEYIKVENSNHDWKNVYFGDSYLTKMIDSEKYSDYAAWTEFLIDSYKKGNISYSSLIKAGYNPELELSYYLNHEKHIDNQPTFREIVAVAPRENVYAVFEIQKHSFPNLYLVDQNGNKIKELEAEKYNLNKEGNYFFKNEHFPNGLDDYRLEILAEDNQEYSFTNNVQNIQDKERILSILEENSDYWIIEFNETDENMPKFTGQKLTKETIERIMSYETPISLAAGFYKFYFEHHKKGNVIDKVRLDLGDGMLTNREIYDYLFSEVAKIDEKRKVFAAETDENISVQTTPLNLNEKEEIETKVIKESTINVQNNQQLDLMTLQRLDNDIKNYIASVEKNTSALYGNNPKDHIEYMQTLFNSLDEKPTFITQNKIDSYAAELGVMDLSTAIQTDNKKAIKSILASGIKEYLQSDTYKNFLNFASSMHQYSQKNLRLILSQYPNASLIASHTDWKAKGRYINKGSKAIRVYAPIFGYKKDEEGNFIKDEKGRKIPTGEIVAWRLAPVFDVSQTNGKEIPKQLYELTENFKSPEAFTSIFNAVKKCTTATVSFGNMELSPGARGYYIPSTHEIVIKKGMSSYQTLKTEIHEVVHSVLHNKQNEFIPAAQMEFEAESVAYIVCNHFGVDTSDYSFGYLSSWTAAGSKLEEFEQSLATICNTAKSLITQIEKEINQELNIKENKVQEKLNPYQEKIRKAQEQLKVQSENKTEQNNLVKK